MIESTTQRLHVRASGSSVVAASDATTNLARLRAVGRHEGDAVEAQRGHAAPVVRDRAAGASESAIEQQTAVVRRLQAMLTETRDAVAHLVNNGTSTAGHRDADPAVTGAAHTIMRAPEEQRPQPLASSAQTNGNGTGPGSAGANTVQAAAPVGYVMSQAEAEAIAVEIYADAFPGVSFTRNELAAAVAQLRTGLITREKLCAEVHEGAALINNTQGDVAGAQERAPGRHPNRQSTIAQELRLQRLAALMEAGILPENKFTINGNFSYNQGAAIPKGRFVESMEALQARNAPRGPAMLGRELQRSMERFKTNVTNQQVSQEGNDGVGDRRINRSRAAGRVARGIDPNINLKNGNETLIRGTMSRPPAPPITSTASTGQPANGAFSLSSASLSDLSELSDEMNDRSFENNTEPPPPPPPSGDPIALDLNHDGKIGVTGNSTAKDHKVENATVAFDLDGDGRRDKTEWMNGDGDGLLVDDHDGEMSRIAAYRGDVDVKRLFGDENGRFAHGYEKLAGFDTNKDGKISGGELDQLKVWIDDGDARLEEGELKTLGELGITELSVRMDLVQNEKGETLMRSTFDQNGQTHMTEDVWFGMDGRAESGQRGFLEHMKQALTESTAELRGRMLRRLDAAIVEVDTINRDLEDRRNHATLGTRAQQGLVAAQLGGMRV